MTVTQTELSDVDVDIHEEKERCPDCNGLFDQLGRHWGYGCDPPRLSTEQKDIVTGLLMGDGSRGKSGSKNRCLVVGMTTKPFLDWLTKKFGILCSGIGSSKTGLENKNTALDTGIINVSGDSEFKNTFRWRTKCLPELTQPLDYWYRGGEFHFPDELRLNPMVLKMWYVCDGSLQWGHNDKNPYIVFTNESEKERYTYFQELFNQIDMFVRYDGKRIELRPRDTQKFFDYIGLPPTNDPAGFSYKWQWDSHEAYTKLKEIHDSQPYLDD